jgi:diacylglycerol O-acyltransferase / wax synthase
MSVLFDQTPESAVPAVAREPWMARPFPSGAQLLAEALIERATAPAEIARSVRAFFRAPRLLAEGAREAALGLGAMLFGSLRPAPPTPYNCQIGPHRRFTWVRAQLADVKAIKDELGGTVNDVVLASVAGGLGRHLRRRGRLVDGLDLRAMVPVSVRTDPERGALGNRVAAMMAPLPVWCEDPVDRLAIVGDSMRELKEGGQAVGAQVLTQLGGFAPPTVMSQATRLAARQRFFNLVVTNIPGPQFPLYVMGRELVDVFPMVPLARNQALGIAIMSYNGRLNFGLVGDYDALPDLDDLAGDLADSLQELAGAAGIVAAAERAEPIAAGNGHPAWNRAP